ncbi:YbaY family lipoprotein [Pseudomonas sp. H11T01]|uniref:YbaY family lipoprotein n=1 Tax=Pseudomonas sp. H11T01 TaxID=3402749 RepID=UPI003ACD22EC
MSSETVQTMDKVKTLTLNFVYPQEVISWEGMSANLVIRDITSAENPVSIVAWGTNQLANALETMSFDVVNPTGLARYSMSLELARDGASLFSCSEHLFNIYWKDTDATDNSVREQKTIYLDSPGTLTVENLAMFRYPYPADSVITLKLTEISETGAPGDLLNESKFLQGSPRPFYVRYDTDKVKPGQRYKLTGSISRGKDKGEDGAHPLRSLYVLKPAQPTVSFGSAVTSAQ